VTEVATDILRVIPLDKVVRIDVGLEGNWSESVVPVWRRGEGLLGFEQVARSHPDHKPSMELYFDGAWVGVPCFVHQGGANVFDSDLAAQLVQRVESSAPVGGTGGTHHQPGTGRSSEA